MIVTVEQARKEVKQLISEAKDSSLYVKATFGGTRPHEFIERNEFFAEYNWLCDWTKRVCCCLTGHWCNVHDNFTVQANAKRPHLDVEIHRDTYKSILRSTVFQLEGYLGYLNSLDMEKIVALEKQMQALDGLFVALREGVYGRIDDMDKRIKCSIEGVEGQGTP